MVDSRNNVRQLDLFGQPPTLEEAGAGPTIKLSPDQQEVYDALIEWAAHPEGVMTLGGYAGSGKSTLTGTFAKAVTATARVAFISYTGRAAGVLRKKLAEAGVATTANLADVNETMLSRGSMVPLCTTVHRFLYKPVINKSEEIVGWSRRHEPDRNYHFIVIDEASMIGDRLLGDIQTFATPILAVGDHGQLPPVQDSGSLMRRPMLRLEQIHRQAVDNPIIQLATAMRERGIIEHIKDKTGAIRFAPRSKLPDVIRETHVPGATLSDVGILCHLNASRVMLNGIARRALHYEGVPRQGEPIVCLKNMQDDGVWNGMRGRLIRDTRLGREPWILDASVEFPEEAIPASNYQMCAPQFMRERTYASVEELQKRGVKVSKMSSAGRLFDFGYAMTVHKYQGSQVRTVILYLDRLIVPTSSEWRRWCYTAITRASEKLIIVR